MLGLTACGDSASQERIIALEATVELLTEQINDIETDIGVPGPAALTDPVGLRGFRGRAREFRKPQALRGYQAPKEPKEGRDHEVETGKAAPQGEQGKLGPRGDKGDDTGLPGPQGSHGPSGTGGVSMSDVRNYVRDHSHPVNHTHSPYAGLNYLTPRKVVPRRASSELPIRGHVLAGITVI